MNLNPLWAPTRRLPRYATTPPPAYTDHEHDRLAGNGPGVRRFGSVHLPFRSRATATKDDDHPARPGQARITREGKRRSMPASGLMVDSRRPERRYSASNSVHESRNPRPAGTYHSRTGDYVDTSYQCEVGCCGEKQLPDKAYCVSHKCCLEECGDVRAVRSRYYCSTHRCGCCDRRAVPGSRYCGDHKCIVKTCPGRKKGSRKWCAGHRCRWEECDREPIDGSAYCRDHACAAGHCAAKVTFDGSRLGNYCCCHTCDVEGCQLRSSHAGPFCVEHECRAPGCPNPRFWADERGGEREHECCRFHTCVQRECFAPTAQTGVPCDLHAKLYSYSVTSPGTNCAGHEDDKTEWEREKEKERSWNCNHDRCSSHQCNRWKTDNNNNNNNSDHRRRRRSHNKPSSNNTEDRDRDKDRDGNSRRGHRSSRYQNLEIRIIRVTR